jgi:hypothetical protein
LSFVTRHNDFLSVFGEARAQKMMRFLKPITPRPAGSYLYTKFVDICTVNQTGPGSLGPLCPQSINSRNGPDNIW